MFFFQNTRSIFKNKSMEIKKKLSYKKIWAHFLIFNIKIHVFFLKKIGPLSIKK